MKSKILVGLMVAGMVIAGGAVTAFAQNGPRNGKVYGGPPKSEEERAARQAACLEKNGGVCPTGEPRANCPGYGQGGQGKGKGYGQGARQGLRDGTGPRNGNGTCPNVVANSRK